MALTATVSLIDCSIEITGSYPSTRRACDGANCQQSFTVTRQFNAQLTFSMSKYM